MSLADTLAALDGKAMLTADDAIALRRVIYGGKLEVNEAEADAMFSLNADAGQLSPEWQALFAEVMADFVVRQADPPGYVSEPRAAWLIGAVSRYRRIRPDEVEMLIHVLEEADQTTASLSIFTLNTVKALALWRLQRAGALDTVDVERLRRVVFAKGGDSNDQVTRGEAEVLFDINDALAGRPAEGWTEFFTKAVTNAVLFETTWRADADKARKLDAWVADTAIHPLHRLAAERPADYLAQIREGFLEVHQWDFFHEDRAEMNRWVAADETLEARAEAVTGDEAHWLVARIGQDGRYDANEHALIAYIRANARSVDPSLQAVIQALEAKTTVAMAS